MRLRYWIAICVFEKLNSSYISILLSHFHLTSAGTDKNIWMILSILIHFSILNKLARFLLFIKWLECMHMNCFEIWGRTVKFYAQDFLNKSSLPRYCSYWTRIILTTDFGERRVQPIESTYRNIDLYLTFAIRGWGWHFLTSMWVYNS